MYLCVHTPTLHYAYINVVPPLPYVSVLRSAVIRSPGCVKLSLPMSPTIQHILVCVDASSPNIISFRPRPFGLLRPMPANRTPMATSEQNSPSKVPLLTAGDISPAVMRQFHHAYLNYFVHKKVIVDDQVSMVIGGLLDHCIA